MKLAFFSVPAVHCQIGEARDFLHERGMKVMATTPSATETYTDADLTGPMAVVLGSLAVIVRGQSTPKTTALPAKQSTSS